MGFFDILSSLPSQPGSTPTDPNQPSGTVTIQDGTGKNIGGINLVNGIGSYSRVLTKDNIGQNTISTQYTGDTNFASRSTDNFTSHIANANGANSTTNALNQVTKIVAGPGIYISSPDGQGVVTISLQPLNPVTTDDLYSVTYTHFESAKYNDMSMFMAVGANGASIYSDDGQNWSDIGAKNAQGAGGATINLYNIINVENSSLADDGSLYFCIQSGVDPTNVFGNGTNGINDYLSVLWGRLGYTNSSGVTQGDGINYQSSTLIDNTGEIRDQYIQRAQNFYKPGETVTASCYLIFGNGGSIWNCPTFPCDQIDIKTGGTNSPITIVRELNTGIAQDEMGFADSNLVDNPWTSYKVIVTATDTKKLYASNRNQNQNSTWSSVHTCSQKPIGIAYGGSGIWVVTGFNDYVAISSDDGNTWTESTIGKPGQIWQAIAYGNGKFVTVGPGGAMAYSTDDGNTWTLGDSGTTNDLKAIAYSEKLMKFAAVGAKRTTVCIQG